jgi:hypothetical protein
MRRVLVVGQFRSGTTWLSHVVGAPPVRYIHEPDNFRDDRFAWAATLGLGFMPSLEVGDEAPAYRRLWQLAFAGGWPDLRRLRMLRRASESRYVPRPLRIKLALAAARLATEAASPPPTVLVKTVFAGLSTEWLAHEFDPAMVIVWRHPLNIVPAWIERGYPAEALNALKALRTRFERTEVWPPPAGESLESTTWAACAIGVILLEAASRHPDWLVISHEELCVDPLVAFRSVFAGLGLPEPADLAGRLAETDRPGTGYEIHRETAMQPLRWRHRLSPADQETILNAVRRFEETSPVAASAWSQSPALYPAEEGPALPDVQR